MNSQAIRIKNEPADDGPADLSAPQALADGDDFEDEDEGILEDTAGVRYYQDSGFKIKQVVQPTIVQRSIGDLYALSRTKYLKLDPEYQREVVWDEMRASALIASLFQGYFIPPIIFNVLSKAEPLDDGSGRKVLRHYRITVDGKQRLTSVQKFMEGHIGVLDSNVPAKRWYYCHPKVDGVEKESMRNIFEESTKEFFRSRAFCCYEYSELPESVEENMFQLVQRGMPLTPAEKMRALSTKWASFTKQYEEDYALVVNLIKQSRASGFRSIITMFCQILEVASPSGSKRVNREGVGSRPVLQSSPQVLTKLLFDDKSLDEDVKFRFKEIFDRYQKLVELTTIRSSAKKLGFTVIPNTAFDPAPDYLTEHGVGHVKTFSPIEQLATAVLLSVHMETRTDEMLLGDVMEMRRYLREKHTDLRINQMCWNTAWDYINSEMSRQHGSSTTPCDGQDTDNAIQIGDDNSRISEGREEFTHNTTASQITQSGQEALSEANDLRSRMFYNSSGSTSPAPTFQSTLNQDRKDRGIRSSSESFPTHPNKRARSGRQS